MVELSILLCHVDKNIIYLREYIMHSLTEGDEMACLFSKGDFGL